MALILIALAGGGMFFLIWKKDLLRSKTAWAAVVGWVAAIPLFVSGEIGIVELVGGLGTLIGTLFLRGSIEQNLSTLLNKFKFWKSGTVWTLVFTVIVTNVLAYLNGQLDFKIMIVTIVTGAIGVFLRSATSAPTG